jgi:ribosomal protein L7/L12
MDEILEQQLIDKVTALEAQVAWLMGAVQWMQGAAAVPATGAVPAVAPTAPSGAPTDRWGHALNPGLMPDVLEMVAAGNKIGAIKRYRELTGGTLGDAKNAIDALG